MHGLLLQDVATLETAELVSCSLQVGDMAAMVRARSRWVVTGTPIGSGGLTDLHGLLRVLQHDPFQDRQLWRACIARPYARGSPAFTVAGGPDT